MPQLWSKEYAGLQLTFAVFLGCGTLNGSRCACRACLAGCSHVAVEDVIVCTCRAHTHTHSGDLARFSPNLPCANVCTREPELIASRQLAEVPPTSKLVIAAAQPTEHHAPDVTPRPPIIIIPSSYRITWYFQANTKSW